MICSTCGRETPEDEFEQVIRAFNPTCHCDYAIVIKLHGKKITANLVVDKPMSFGTVKKV